MSDTETNECACGYQATSRQDLDDHISERVLEYEYVVLAKKTTDPRGWLGFKLRDESTASKFADKVMATDGWELGETIWLNHPVVFGTGKERS